MSNNQLVMIACLAFLGCSDSLELPTDTGTPDTIVQGARPDHCGGRPGKGKCKEPPDTTTEPPDTTTEPPAAVGLPVIPGAAGYGMETPAGRYGKVLRVTSLEDDPSDPQPGTLRHALLDKGPRVIVFEVSGMIDLGLHGVPGMGTGHHRPLAA